MRREIAAVIILAAFLFASINAALVQKPASLPRRRIV